ncbi:HMG box transcription factor BBX [Elysia marginata]|uniref:HMG box transcription factor BBX n=1 Tax=Elysia marginata TaxID=1093978 RepID=A0AAV4JX67_9GAST|nr:HMG box transcription factor BBX [Elysia marginata]
MDSDSPVEGSIAAEQPPVRVASAKPRSPRNSSTKKDFNLKKDTTPSDEKDKETLENFNNSLTPANTATDKSSDDAIEGVKHPEPDNIVSETGGQPLYSAEHLLPLLSHSQPASPTEALASPPSCSSGSGANDGVAAAGTSGTVRRPMNGFLIFCKRQRATVREANPELDNRSITRVLGDLWSKLGPEKATYTNMAKQNKEAFLKANPNFKWSGDRVQTGATRSSRKVDSGGSVKPQEDTITHGVIPLSSAAVLSPDLAEKTPVISQPAAAVQNSGSDSMTQMSVGKEQGQQHHALLQLAEMCSSEASLMSAAASSDHNPATALAGQSFSQHSQMASHSSTAPAQSSHAGSSGSSLGPLKKRAAKHWSQLEDSGGRGGCLKQESDTRNHQFVDVGIDFQKGADREFDRKGTRPMLVNRSEGIRSSDQRRSEEFGSVRDSPVGLKYEMGRALVSVDNSNSNASNFRERQAVYSHPNSDLYSATASNWSKDREFNPLNLSLPRGQEPTLAAESLQRPGEVNRTSGIAAGNRISSFGETYAAVEWYKSANHRYRKVSSSATESIPSYSPPPPPHHPNDDGSLNLSGSGQGQAPSIPSTRWRERAEDSEEYNALRPSSECTNPKFFSTTDQRTKLHVAEIRGRLSTDSPDFSRPSTERGHMPTTSIVARMMMQQPHQQEVLSRAGADYLSSSHSTSVGSRNMMACEQQDQSWSAAPRLDTLSKLLASNVPTPSSKSSSESPAQIQNLNPDFHQWREPQGTAQKPGHEETQSISHMTGQSLASAPFVARHQLPLAVPTQPSSFNLLSSAKHPALSAATSLSLPLAGTSSLSTQRSRDSSIISSSLGGPLPNPTVYRQADVTTVSLDAQAPRQEVREAQDPKPSLVPDPTKLSTSTGTYSEGKLKKKWTQRMLVEEKMEEDRNRILLLQASEESKKALGILEGNSWAGSKLSHTVPEHSLKTGVAPSARLALNDSPSSMIPRYASYPTGNKALVNQADGHESSPAYSKLNFQTVQEAAFIKAGGPTSNAATSKMLSIHNNMISNYPPNDTAGKNVLSLGGSSTTLSGDLSARPPFSGSGVGTTGSSILSTCLMAKQPLASVKSSMSTLAPPPSQRSFNASSHPKLMLQLSKGTTPSPALLNSNSSTLLSSSVAPSLPFQPSTGTKYHREKVNGQVVPVSSSSSSLFSSSPLLPFSSNSLLLPPSSSASPLLVISSNVGQPSDTLKVDLGAGGWRAKASPTLADDQLERLTTLKDTNTSISSLAPPVGTDLPKIMSLASKPSEYAAPSGPPDNGKQKAPKPEKPTNKKGPKGPRKASVKKNGGLAEGDKELSVSNKEANPSNSSNVPRGKRKKKEVVNESGEEPSAEKPKTKRGRRKAPKKEEALQTKDVSPNESQANLLDKMRILNPIAACGKKIVDHIVEQFVKSSDFEEDYSDKPDPFLIERGLNSQGKGSSMFARSGETLAAGSHLDNIVTRTFIGEDGLGKFPRDLKRDIHETSKLSVEGKMSWRSVKEEVDVKSEPALLSGPKEPKQNFKTEEGVVRPQHKLFGDGEQLGKVKLEDGRTGWPPKLFNTGPEVSVVPGTVKAEGPKEKIFGGSRPWIGNADERERNLFPACSLVERVVREVCGSSLEKKNCFSCKKKEEPSSFSKSGVCGESNLTKVQDLMLGKASVPRQNFPSPAAASSQRSSVWNTYRQNNDSPTNDEWEKKPVLRDTSPAVTTASFNSHSSLLHGYQQWKSVNIGADASGINNSNNSSSNRGGGNGNIIGRGGCLSMADLIEHHLQQQEAEDQQRRSQRHHQGGEEEDEDDEEEEQLLQSRPVRKSRRANRGQKYQELIKEGFIQPSRDRVARGSSSQEDPMFDVAVDQSKRGFKRRASERDILASQSPVPPGSLSRSSSVSSQSRTGTRKSSFDLEREADDDLAFETGAEKKRKQAGSSTSDRVRGGKYEDNAHETMLSSSASHGRTDVSGKSAGVNAGKENSKESEVPTTTPAVTGSRKRKARKHCITRISVVGQTSGPDSLPCPGSSEQSLREHEDAGDAPKPKYHQSFEAVDGKPKSALSSAAATSVLISPACKDLISSPVEKIEAKSVKPASSNASSNVQGDHSTQPKTSHQHQNVEGENKKGAGAPVASESSSQGSTVTALGQQSNAGHLQISSHRADRDKPLKLTANHGLNIEKSTDKKENCSLSPKNVSLSQVGSVKHESLFKDSSQSTALPTTQPELPNVLHPSKNSPSESSQNKGGKSKKAKSAGMPTPKKASKLRKALLSEEQVMNKPSSALDLGTNTNLDAKEIVAGAKGKRVRLENGKSKSPAARKPRLRAVDSDDCRPPQKKKSKAVKASEGCNKDTGKKKAPKKEKSGPSTLSPHIAPSAPVKSAPATPCPTAAPGLPSSSDRLASLQSNQAAVSTPKPKSAILSAILASAPMVDRPTAGLGTTYLSGKPLDFMSAPSAPGLKTLSGGLTSFSGSPKSPGQADTAESGRAPSLGQTSSPPSAVMCVGLGNNSFSSYNISQKSLPVSLANVSVNKNTSQDKSKLGSTNPEMSRFEHRSPSRVEAVTTLSLPPSSLKSSAPISVASSAPSSPWTAGPALFTKTSPPTSATATATTLPQSVRGSPALPVAASSDANL